MHYFGLPQFQSINVYVVTLLTSFCPAVTRGQTGNGSFRTGFPPNNANSLIKDAFQDRKNKQFLLQNRTSKVNFLQKFQISLTKFSQMVTYLHFSMKNMSKSYVGINIAKKGVKHLIK